MTITPQSDDSRDFVQQVELIAHGVLCRYKPETLFLIKIDNWFGSKWLGFSGKALGALGIWNKPYDKPADDIRIPPFVPKRVVSQRRFVTPDYEEVDSGEPVHKHVRSMHALRRKARLLLPNAALMWYSGNSSATGRGAVMVYAPVGDSYWPWYVSLEEGTPWRVTEAWDIKSDDFSRMIEQGQISARPKTRRATIRYLREASFFGWRTEPCDRPSDEYWANINRRIGHFSRRAAA